MIWTRSALAGRKDMVGLQFALKSCSLQPAGLQKPFSKYLSSHLGFICVLGFFNPKMHTTDSPTLPTIKPDIEFCTDWCAIKKLVHPTLLHIHPDVVGCWLSSSFVSIYSTFTKPSFLSCSSSFFFYLNIVINVIGQVYTIVPEWKIAHLFSSIKWRCCKNSLILAIDSLWMLILNWKKRKAVGGSTVKGCQQQLYFKITAALHRSVIYYDAH